MLIDCTDCDGTGTVHYSCCGDDVKGTIYEDYDLCPTCKEHLGGPEPCENCNGTGKIEIEISIWKRIKEILLKKRKI